jgi:hypothetical protein
VRLREFKVEKLRMEGRDSIAWMNNTTMWPPFTLSKKISFGKCLSDEAELYCGRFGKLANIGRDLI